MTIPTDLEGYCGWLNAHEHRAGRWIIIERNGNRTIDFAKGYTKVDPDQLTLIGDSGR